MGDLAYPAIQNTGAKLEYPGFYLVFNIVGGVDIDDPVRDIISDIFVTEC